MSAHEAQRNSTARDHWDEPEEVADARRAGSRKCQDDPAHRWYRLLSLDSFTVNIHHPRFDGWFR